MTLTVTRVTLLQLADCVAITHKQVHIVVIASNYRLYIVSLALPVACSSDVGHHPRAARNLYIILYPHYGSEMEFCFTNVSLIQS